jgi:phosphoribosyl 1,2-cyclic phosphate phosphodiesterase
MKILFLGTGAADYSEEHRNLSGYRRNASALIDETLLIDPGPCVPDALATFKVRTDKIRYVINTHPHSDHFNKETLAALEAQGAKFITFEDGETKQVGAYEITALAANHSIKTQHFIIDDGEKKLFYGLDSAWLLYSEVQEIIQKKIDLAVLDATIGFIEGDYRIFEHNNLPMVIEMKKTLSPHVSRFMISHMARTLHTDHEALVKAMKPHGIEVAFDGWICEI